MLQWPNFLQLLDQGFALDIGPWPVTPLQQGDVLLAQDPAGHVLITQDLRSA